MKRVLIFGIRSWLGFRLCEALAGSGGGFRVAGTSRDEGAESTGNEVVEIFGARQCGDFLRAMDSFQPGVVVNFLRGEDAEGFDVHLAVANWCGGHDASYCYASSALALDGYNGCALTEDMSPRSISPYGKFKQSCEEFLKIENPCHHLVLRFASLQGWVPHKVTRNEAFLRKMCVGEAVTVDRGIFQNRLLDTMFATQVATLLALGAGGTFHLGTVDSSEEFHFLRRVAVAFGHDPALVVSGGDRRVNLVALPGRVKELLGEKCEQTEAQTLEGLVNYGAMARYRASGACTKIRGYKTS